jgi:hypothetical protein
MPVTLALEEERARDALQVWPRRIRPQSGPALRQLQDIILLTVADLHHQPAVRAEFVDGRIQHAFEVQQPVVPSEQRHLRFMAHGGADAGAVQLADVWRIGGDDVEVAFDAAEVGSSEELHAIGHAVPFGILLGDVQCLGGDIRGDDLDVRGIVRDRHADAAAAGADVGDAHCRRGACGADDLEHRFDDQLGFVSRDQHRRRDDEVQSPELAMADDVGRRFMPGAALDPGGERRLESLRHRCFGFDDHAGTIPAEDRPRKEIDVERRLLVGHTRVAQAHSPAVQQLAQCQCLVGSVPFGDAVA